MNKVYTVWLENDDIEPLLVGIATTEKKAYDMTEKLYEIFEDNYEYMVTCMNIDQLKINDEEIMF